MAGLGPLAAGRLAAVKLVRQPGFRQAARRPITNALWVADAGADWSSGILAGGLTREALMLVVWATQDGTFGIAPGQGRQVPVRRLSPRTSVPIVQRLSRWCFRLRWTEVVAVVLVRPGGVLVVGTEIDASIADCVDVCDGPYA